jgi:hypothetical protein
VNFFAHLVVAAEHHEDPAVRFAAMLPDLASMSGVILRNAALSDNVAAGVAVHHRSDEAFHSHRDVIASMSRIRAALTGAAVTRGPARAAAPIGHELLFDNALWSPEREQLLVTTLRHRHAIVGELARALGDAESARIDQLAAALLSHRSHGVVERDAAWISQRIIDLTASRPRLRVERAHAPVLTSALQHEHDSVARVAHAVLGDVVAALS